MDPSGLNLDIAYRDGGEAHLGLSVDRVQAIAIVQVAYASDVTVPFATFRSMFVAEGNADVDHLQAREGSHPILSEWTELEGPGWLLYRSLPSRHNSSAPDLRLEVLGLRAGHPGERVWSP